MAMTQKDKLRVSVCTMYYRIEGDIYVLQGSRLTDMLNVKAHDFLPITNAKIFSSPNDRFITEVPYLAIQRDAIILVVPLDEQVSDDLARREVT